MNSSSVKRVGVLDIQYFNVGGKLYCKEVSIYSPGYTATETIAPPFSYHYIPDGARRSVRYTERGMGMCWSWGFNDWANLGYILKEMTHVFDVVYVKGREKFDYLSKFVPNLELYPQEHLHCITLHKRQPMRIECRFHLKQLTAAKCARNNAKILYEHLLQCSNSAEPPMDGVDEVDKDSDERHEEDVERGLVMDVSQNW